MEDDETGEGMVKKLTPQGPLYPIAANGETVDVKSMKKMKGQAFFCTANKKKEPSAGSPWEKRRTIRFHKGGIPMESKLVLYDNYRKNNGSFTYYLEEQETFNSFAFGNLCESIRRLAETSPGSREVLLQVHGVYADILKCLICHRSPDSLSMIAGLPPGNTDFLEELDKAVIQYLKTCGSEETR